MHILAKSFKALGLLAILIFAGCGQSSDEKTTQGWIDDLKHADEAIRIRAAEELACIRDDAANNVRALAGALQDESSYVRQTAAKSLGLLGQAARDALPALRKALKDAEEGVRFAVEDAIRKIEGK